VWSRPPPALAAAGGAASAAPSRRMGWISLSPEDRRAPPSIAMMKSRTRSSRRARSCAIMPARAWKRWLSQVVKPVVRPPIAEPARAEIADM
jgi:hypothetical protein